MSYIDRRLAENETIMYRGRFHWLEHTFAWASLIFLGVFIIGIFLFIRQMVKIKTTNFAITSERVNTKRGFLKARVGRMSLDGVEGGKVRQSMIGRLLGYGTVIIEGRGDMELPLPKMADPAGFLRAVTNAQAKLRHEVQPVEVVDEVTETSPTPSPLDLDVDYVSVSETDLTIRTA